jgi:hypothetical protein
MNPYERIYNLVTEMIVTVKKKTASTRPTGAVFKSDAKTAIKTADTEHGQRQGARRLRQAGMNTTYKKLRSAGKAGPAVAAAYRAGTYDPDKDYSAENRQMMK